MDQQQLITDKPMHNYHKIMSLDVNSTIMESANDNTIFQEINKDNQARKYR